MTSNQETAELLKKVAAVFRVMEGDTFRVKAYNNAAVAIENSAESVYELWQQDMLDKVPGVGESLKEYLSEYFSKGKVKHFESQFKKVPAGMFSLMEVRGIGPVTAYKISKKFKLDDPKTAIKDLKQILVNGDLSKIEGFKDKTALRIKKALDIKTQAKTKRLLLSEAIQIANEYIDYLNKSPLIVKAETLGSLRRKLSTVGDIDLAICSSKPSEAMDYVTSYPKIAGIVTKGETLSHVKLKNGYEVDIKHAYPVEWGSLLQHYTGSKMHNIALRTYALEKNKSLSEYGIKDTRGVHKFKDEKSFYNFLGMDYIPAEMREDKGEIELAKKRQIPKLIELSNIKGDLHIHSDFVFPSSHDLGDSKLSKILDFAIENKYEYIGISDHNPKFSGLTQSAKKTIIESRKKFLLDQFHAYEKSVKKCTVKLLIGMEVDIRPDGELGLSDDLLEMLDYAIISIHSSFDLDREKNTRRIIAALNHPKAIILGHPTGRMLNSREPISADWEKIFSFCKANQKIIEINASPARLDLPDDLIREAASKGNKFIINTDSHDVSQMNFMEYGVWQARRGWAKKKDVVNTFSYKDLRSMINL